MKDCYYRVWSGNNTQYCWGETERELLLRLTSKYSIWADQIMQKWQPTNSENCQFSNYQKNREKGWREGGNCQRQTSVWRKKNEENRHLLRIFFLWIQLAGTHNIHFRIFFHIKWTFIRSEFCNIKNGPSIHKKQQQLSWCCGLLISAHKNMEVISC